MSRQQHRRNFGEGEMGRVQGGQNPPPTSFYNLRIFFGGGATELKGVDKNWKYFETCIWVV